MIALFFLASAAIGGVAWVFLYPILSGERQAEKRKEMVARSGSSVPARAGRGPQKSRREQVEGTLKELESRNKKKSVPLATKIEQAGLAWSKRRFIVTSVVLGIGAFLLFLGINAGLLPALGAGFAAGVGLPIWLLKFLPAPGSAGVMR